MVMRERDAIKKMTNKKGNFIFERSETPIYFLENLDSFNYRYLTY